jgi:DNA primase
MQFAKDFPDLLKSKILVSEVIGRKVQLKKKGKIHSGLCPFHNEKTPSFTVNDQKGFYHCFGCQEHGDIISFTMKKEGLDFKESVIALANQFAIEIPIVKNYEQSKIQNNDNEIDILEKITIYFEENLYKAEGQEARKYLKSRNIDSKIAKKFRLGFANSSYDQLINHLLNHNFTESQMLNTGVIGINEQHNLYSKIRNRVIYPITNKKNQVIAFGGRTIVKDIPKYLNSNETNLFKKNQTLYNLSNAKKSIYDQGYAVIVEGYMDVISLVKNGIENVVAGLGTAFSVDHIKQLFLITDKIIICLDGDQAGIKATKRLCEIALPLITSDKSISLIILPDALDPDDYLENYGKDSLKNLLANSTSLSKSLFDFAVDDLKIDRSKTIIAEDRAKLEQMLSQKINLIVDNNCKKHFSNFFKESIYQLARTNYKNNFKTTESTINSSKLINLSRQVDKNFLMQKQENIAISIIALLISHPTLCSYRDSIFDIRQVNLSNEKLTSFKEFILELLDNNEKNLLETLDNSEFKCYNSSLKAIVSKFKIVNYESCKNQLQILLLKDLLLQLDIQYQESLNKNEELKTNHSGIISGKIKELYDYKNIIEAKIIELSKN